MIAVVCVAAALVWLLVAVVSSFGRDGSGGEGRVARRLAKLPQEDYQTVNDIMLPTVDGETTQVDHVVVSRYGIFVIETKDYNGWIFGGENQRIWTQWFKGGRWSGPQKFHFQNPIRQNWRHIYAMADCLELPCRYFFNPTFHVREQNPSGCWGCAHRSSLHGISRRYSRRFAANHPVTRRFAAKKVRRRGERGKSG